ncbi:MAG: TonB family protein [Terriglobales bacterium]
MLLNRLESGVLLFQTRQGLVPVEPAFWERVYLLWTFRNFRQLPVPLLNSRQAALVNHLFRKHARVAPQKYDPWLVIGVVENFVPPAIVIEATLAATIDAALATKAARPEEALEPNLAPLAMEAWPVAKIEAAPITSAEVRKERVGHEEIARRFDADLVPRNDGLGLAWFGEAWSKLPWRKLPWSRPSWSRPSWSKAAWSRLATAFGVVSLCIMSVIAWHRIEGIPGSQANNRPRLQEPSSIALPNSPHLAEPPAADENAAAIAPTGASAQSVISPEAAVEPSPVRRASITSVIRSPKRRIRVHDVVSIAKPALAAQGTAIQATRPPLRFVYPAYSEISARGAVSMTAQVNADGSVRSVRVVSGNRALAAAAVRAVRQWRYRPYLKDGQPIATESNIQISFFSAEAISMSFPPRIPVTR